MGQITASTKSFLQRGYEFGVRTAKSAEQKMRVYGGHQFTDRSQNRRLVLIILAGYKPELWGTVLPRISRACLPEMDVCLVSAGKVDDELARLAAAESWSYLTTETNDVSLVQNLAITHHPTAETIIKVDEDILLPGNALRDLLGYYQSVLAAGIHEPAFVAPTLNINGACYRGLLNHLGLLESYEQEFGTAKIATRGIPVAEEEAAARWIWENCGSVDRIADALRDRDPDPQIVGVQFSIGLIAFSRTFWLEIGRFPVYWHRIAAGKSTLGADEEYLCRKAILCGRPMIVAPTVFAGHFSFGRQYASMLRLLESNPEIFETAVDSEANFAN